VIQEVFAAGSVLLVFGNRNRIFPEQSGEVVRD